MTLLQKHGRCLADLIKERRITRDSWWQLRLDQKIRDMKWAIRKLVGLPDPPHNAGPEHICNECR